MAAFLKSLGSVAAALALTTGMMSASIPMLRPKEPSVVEPARSQRPKGKAQRKKASRKRGLGHRFISGGSPAAAQAYRARKSMHPGRSPTLRKTQRALRMEMGR